MAREAGALAAILAVPGLLLIPGYSWVRAFARRTAWAPGGAEGIAFGVALSFVVLALGGVALSALSVPLTRTSWSALAASVTVAALAVAFAPSRGATGPRSVRRPARRRPGPGLLVAAAALAAIASAIAGAVVLTLRSDAVNRNSMTELALRASVGASGERLLAVEVRNRENRAAAYTLRLLGRAGETARFDRQLPNGGLWIENIDLTDARYRGAAVRVQLYRADRPTTPYREVWLIGRGRVSAAVCAPATGIVALLPCSMRGSLPGEP